MNSKSPVVSGIKNVINKEEESDIKFLKCFEQPTSNSATFFAFFNPSENILIAAYAKSKGVEFQSLKSNLNGNHFSLRSMKWPNHWAVMSSNPWGTVWSTLRPLDKESLYFEFQSISEVDNYFYIKSVKWMACRQSVDVVTCWRETDIVFNLETGNFKFQKRVNFIFGPFDAIGLNQTIGQLVLLSELSFCQAYHSTMAEPRTSDQQRFVAAELQQQSNIGANFLTRTYKSTYEYIYVKCNGCRIGSLDYWIGVTDIVLEIHWEYASDENTVTDLYWGPNEPDGHIGEVISASSFGKWHDVVCTTKRNFIFKKENSSSILLRVRCIAHAMDPSPIVSGIINAINKEEDTVRKFFKPVTIHTDNVGKKASRNYPSNKIYTQLTPYGILPVNDVSLEFQVKACNDAFVLLSSASDLNSTVLYEIVIGSRSNTAIFLRRKYGGITALMTGIKAIVLFCDEYTNLFVNWSNSGRITVGNDSHTFIDWTDPYPLMIEGYGIMTGWGSNGSWIFNLEEATCECECTADIQNLSNYTHAELLEILAPEITKIRQHLLVDKTQLSSTIRRLTSAPDNRKSSKGVGLIAVVLFVSMIGTVIVIDFPALLKQSNSMRQLCRRFCSKVNIGAIKSKY
ncbi:unnamed protein product [Mytilus coruscus]|uniref:C-type lectin domain-containing protein n=1 Tax=Mytilus coruscus TaxID=42192 RepID=A0A6J8CTW9_MYTCO|nr:unnamed protein product [Mytilus coruscus]